MFYLTTYSTHLQLYGVGQMFYLTTYSTHFICGYMASEGRKEENVYLTMYSAHFIYGYMASDIW